jgi:hypothetical protein
MLFENDPRLLFFLIFILIRNIEKYCRLSVTSEVISLRQQLSHQNGMRGIEDSKLLERANQLATANVSLQLRTSS